MTASPRTYQRRYQHVVVMLCNMWLVKSAPALLRHDHNVDDMVVLSIVGGRLPMFKVENLPSKYNVNEIKSV